MNYWQPNISVLIRRQHPAKSDRVHLMLCSGDDRNGPAYTKEEWATDSTADWEFVDGALLFQGSPFTEPHEIEDWR